MPDQCVVPDLATADKDLSDPDPEHLQSPAAVQIEAVQATVVPMDSWVVNVELVKFLKAHRSPFPTWNPGEVEKCQLIKKPNPKLTTSTRCCKQVK